LYCFICVYVCHFFSSVLVFACQWALQASACLHWLFVNKFKFKYISKISFFSLESGLYFSLESGKETDFWNSCRLRKSTCVFNPAARLLLPSSSSRNDCFFLQQWRSSGQAPSRKTFNIWRYSLTQHRLELWFAAFKGTCFRKQWDYLLYVR